MGIGIGDPTQTQLADENFLIYISTQLRLLHGSKVATHQEKKGGWLIGVFEIGGGGREVLDSPSKRIQQQKVLIPHILDISSVSTPHYTPPPPLLLSINRYISFIQPPPHLPKGKLREPNLTTYPTNKEYWRKIFSQTCRILIPISYLSRREREREKETPCLRGRFRLRSIWERGGGKPSIIYNLHVTYTLRKM